MFASRSLPQQVAVEEGERLLEIVAAGIPVGHVANDHELRMLDAASRYACFNAGGIIDSGNLYADTTPWGIDGGFWHARLSADFD